MTRIFLLAYFSMLSDGAGHHGALKYARNEVRIARRMRIEKTGRTWA